MLDNAVTEKLHAFRESLNPDHHDYIGNIAIEEARDYVKGVLEFLYSEI